MASDLKKRLSEKGEDTADQPDAQLPQMIFDSFLVNFESFIILLSASDVTIIDKSAANILAFVHFSMI